MVYSYPKNNSTGDEDRNILQKKKTQNKIRQ